MNSLLMLLQNKKSKIKHCFDDWKTSQIPNRLIFEDIYARNIWGGTSGEYYSGGGSDESIASRYAEIIVDLINKHKITSIIDLGCGDFRVGKLLSVPNCSYVGIDVVPSLISRNKRLFESANISFICLDAVTDKLPDGELCLIRQVFQHLSNAEIASILKKVKKYKYLVITEHHPAPSMCVQPNNDIVHGSANRIPINSGVYPHLPPFNIGPAQILLEVDEPYGAPGEKIVTMLFQ